MTKPKDLHSGLTLETLTELLEYDSDKGIFTHRKKINQASGQAGYLNPATGYTLVKVRGRRYMAHRLAWFYTYGVWPKERLDHINCDKRDNRICNLREATDFENSGNKRVQKNKTLPKGVEKITEGRFRARICVKNRRIELGTFDSPDEANAAYAAAAGRVFGEFSRAG